MELGSLFKNTEFSATRVLPSHLVSIINQLLLKNVTSKSAKKLLRMKFEGDTRSPKQIIEEDHLDIWPLSHDQYRALAHKLLTEHEQMVKDIVEKGQEKKIMWFVGQMMSTAREGSVEPDKARQVLERLLEKRKKGEKDDVEKDDQE